MFETYKFRPSQVGNLMTSARSKSEPLSETTKSYLLSVFIKEKFGREKDISNKYMEKGNLVEEDSLSLVTKNLGKLYIKNKNVYSNEFIAGTPDIIDGDTIVDIKSSWDLFTFAKADTSTMYYWQLQCYMWLTGKTKAELVFCLVNSPQHLIFQETKRTSYAQGLADMEGTPEYAEMEKQVELNMTFDDIPEKDRVKTYPILFSSDAIEELKEKVLLSRQYLEELTL